MLLTKQDNKLNFVLHLGVTIACRLGKAVDFS